jgi:hypothetical protein
MPIITVPVGLPQSALVTVGFNVKLFVDPETVITVLLAQPLVEFTTCKV